MCYIKSIGGTKPLCACYLIRPYKNKVLFESVWGFGDTALSCFDDFVWNAM